MIAGLDAKKLALPAGPVTISGVPAGMEPLILADLARAGAPVAFIMSDSQRMADFEQMLGFAAPDIPVLSLPAWDCLPYDRVSPSADTSARRLAAAAGPAPPHAIEALRGERARRPRSAPFGIARPTVGGASARRR